VVAGKNQPPPPTRICNPDGVRYDQVFEPLYPHRAPQRRVSYGTYFIALRRYGCFHTLCAALSNLFLIHPRKGERVGYVCVTYCCSPGGDTGSGTVSCVHHGRSTP